MFNFDVYDDFDEYVELPDIIYDDGVDDHNYIITGCDPAEYDNF